MFAYISDKPKKMLQTQAFFLYGRCDFLIMAMLMGGLKEKLQVGYAPLLKNDDADMGAFDDLLKEQSNIDVAALTIEKFVESNFIISTINDVIIVDFDFQSDASTKPNVTFDAPTVMPLLQPRCDYVVIAVVFKIKGYDNGKPLDWNHYVSFIDGVWHDPATPEAGSFEDISYVKQKHNDSSKDIEIREVIYLVKTQEQQQSQ